MAGLMAQTVKRLYTMWETQVRSLGQEDPLEKEMAIHSSTIAWKIPWTEEPGRLQSMGSQRDTTERLHFHFHFHGVRVGVCPGVGLKGWLRCLAQPSGRVLAGGMLSTLLLLLGLPRWH